MGKVEQEIRDRLHAYAAAFSSQEIARILPHYARNGLVTFYRFPRGNQAAPSTVRVFNGKLPSALLRFKLPLGLMMRAMLYGLRRRGYARSVIEIFDVEARDANLARAHVRFDRLDGTGKVYESLTAVYVLTLEVDTWRIHEVWAFDPDSPPPPALGIARHAR
ncbi:MAG: hypothetical protein QM778_07300 [Myxococcales bacterium]